jgi:hypothetical protein
MNQAVSTTIALISLALVFGCAGGGGGGGTGGSGVTFSPQFAMPGEGATLEDVFQLEVTGAGVVRVFFKVNGTLVLEDTVAPFALEIDPATYPEGAYKIVVTAQASNGREEKRTINVFFVQPDRDPAQILAAIAALGPGEWYEIPESHLRDVAWDGDYRGNVAGIIGAASGGAYDTKRNRLIVWGGGQGSYYGNEIYAFDVPTVSWLRLNDPASFAPGEEDNPYNRPQYPDGSPVPRHTYDYIEYVPEPYDRFVVGGGAALWKTSFRDTHTYAFDFDTLTWETLPDTPSASIGAVAAVAPDGRFWMQGAQGDDRNHLAVLDAVAATWTQHVSWDGWRDGDQTAEIDPGRNLLVAVGNGATYVWDLDTPDVAATRLATTGDTVIELPKGPGLAYHPGRDVMVAWHGGAVFTLDLDTAAWTQVPAAGSVSPPGAAIRGTFGRWRYVATLDVFIVVSDADTNVYVYRLP